jgi:predicted lipoprotein with Yx(FWY)xxD motif
VNRDGLPRVFAVIEEMSSPRIARAARKEGSAMRSGRLNVGKTAAVVAGSAVALALVLTACSSGSSSGTAAAAGASTSAVAGTAPVANAAARVVAHGGPMGTFLTDAAGKALYMFASDTASKSTCNGACATYWPAFTTKGKASVTGALSNAKLSTITRSDGTTQVAYAGHPLYYYVGDTKPGATTGEGLTDFGAYWWLLAPTGKPITGGSSGGGNGGSSGGGGGW